MGTCARDGQLRVARRATTGRRRPSQANLHLQIIFFGREHCAALRHDAAACLLCRWAAVDLSAQGGPLKAGQSPRKRLSLGGGGGGGAEEGAAGEEGPAETKKGGAKGGAKRQRRAAPGGDAKEADVQ